MKQMFKWLWRGTPCIALLLFILCGAAGAAQPPDAAEAQLGQALKYYYDKDYARALAIFEKIEGPIDSLDLMFWTGAAASRAGACETAIEQLEKLVDAKPDFQQARLELGAAYYNCGRYDQAKETFDALLAASPPPEIQSVARKYLTGIEKAERKFTWNLRFSQSYQYDSNINSGPAKSLIEDAGVDIVLNDDNTEQSSSNWISDIRAGFRYDAGKTGGFLWAGAGNFYYLHSFEDSDYNYLSADLSAGPELVCNKGVIRLPAGFIHKDYGGEALSDTFYVHPNLEHFFRPDFSVRAGYRFSTEQYDPDRYADAGYDNDNHKISAGPVLYLADRKYIISGLLTHEEHDADAGERSYDARHASVTFLARLATNTELLFHYKYTDKSYDAPSGLYAEAREDDRHTFIVVAGQNFMERYFVSAELAYIDNRSNGDLYEFEKTMFTLSAGVKF